MAESGSRTWLWSLRKEEVKKELDKYRVTFEPDAKLAELRFLLRTALNRTKTANGGRAGRYDKLLVDLDRSEIELDGLTDPENDGRDDDPEGEGGHRPSDEEETEEAEEEDRLREDQIRAEIEAEERERELRERVENELRERIENEIRERIEREVRERMEREFRERAELENNEAECEKDEREREERAVEEREREREREREEQEREREEQEQKERAERLLRERLRHEIRAQIAREREQPPERHTERRSRPSRAGQDQGTPPARHNASIPGPSTQQNATPARRSVDSVFPHTDADELRRRDLVRKWGVIFKGERDVQDFLERLEELAESYGYELDQLIPCIPMLLRDKALLWYRNNKRDWASWEDFSNDLKAFYLPPGLELELEEQIRNRMQGTSEPAAEYATRLQTLMRRHGKMSETARLTRLYQNLRPEYRRYMKRSEFTNVAEMLRLAGEYEQLISQEKTSRPKETKTVPRQPPNPTRTSPLEIMEYDRRDHCWRCREKGHARWQCPNPWVKFCSRCGELGTTFRDCPCPGPGNANRTGTSFPQRPTTSREATKAENEPAKRQTTQTSNASTLNTGNSSQPQ